VICEKPSVAADVARALAGSERFTKTEWGFSSDTTWVTAAAGHLVAELPPEKYDEAYKEWNFDHLPILPESFRYQPRDSRAATRLKTLAALMRDPAVDTVVNACDAGREGELIFKLIAQYAKPGKPIVRAWFSSMTPAAIQQAFVNLRPDREMIPLESAARSRAEADWFVGMNATRAASLKLGGGRQLLSVGRVQTPTLAIVVRRDLEIEAFEPEEYFTLEATFQAQAGQYQGSWRSAREPEALDRFATRAEAEAHASSVRAAGRARVASVEKRTERVNPPRLFDLTALQREANQRYGITAAKTLEAAQACYERHKVLSYPRTDSSYLPSDMAPAVPKMLEHLAKADPEFAGAVSTLKSEGFDPAVLVNDAKISDHHGLVPVEGSLDLSALSSDERKIFDLVAWRFLAALGKVQVLERTVVWSEVPAPGGALWFRSAGRVEIEKGWRTYWPESQKKAAGSKTGKGDTSEEEENTDGGEQDLPALTEGEQVKVSDATVTARTTKPPTRFNEATLLGAMATAGKMVEDADLAEAMRESGLGTPATRASILERLVEVGYLERSGRQLLATAKGRGLVLALGEHPLVSPELTGSWEKRLREMERATPSQAEQLRVEFSVAVRSFTAEVVEGCASLTPEMLLAGRRLICPCPAPGCAGSVVLGRKGWGCTSWKSREESGCGFVIWKENAGKKLTERQMLTIVEEMRQGKRPAVPVRLPRVVLGPCPSDGCGGEVLERAKSWGCSSWKSPSETGCGYVIWKSNADGTEVDPARAAEMIAAGETNARPAPTALASCPMPRCKGSIVEREKSFSCNSWKSPTKKGCGLTLWKTAKDGSVLVTLDTLDSALAKALEEREARKKKS
jgi:DNA topoisomerase III